NILNPANGSPITVPSQDMVLGLYYMTKGRKSSDEIMMKGEGQTFYSAEEVVIAYNQGRVDINTFIKVRIKNTDKEGNITTEIVETTVGRVLFNEVVPKEVGFINEVLNKRALRDIIGKVLKQTNVPRTGEFLNEIKNLGYDFAFRGG